MIAFGVFFSYKGNLEKKHQYRGPRRDEDVKFSGQACGMTGPGADVGILYTFRKNFQLTEL
jgi:hypothetical protein